MQLAAPVAAHGHEGQARREGGRQALLPERAQQYVGKAGACPHQPLDRLLLDEARLQLILRLAQQAAAGLDLRRLAEQGWQSIEQRPVERCA